MTATQLACQRRTVFQRRAYGKIVQIFIPTSLFLLQLPPSMTGGKPVSQTGPLRRFRLLPPGTTASNGGQRVCGRNGRQFMATDDLV